MYYFNIGKKKLSYNDGSINNFYYDTSKPIIILTDIILVPLTCGVVHALDYNKSLALKLMLYANTVEFDKYYIDIFKDYLSELVYEFNNMLIDKNRIARFNLTNKNGSKLTYITNNYSSCSYMWESFSEDYLTAVIKFKSSGNVIWEVEDFEITFEYLKTPLLKFTGCVSMKHECSVLSYIKLEHTKFYNDLLGGN